MQRSGSPISLVGAILLGPMTGCCGVFVCEDPPAAPCDIETLVINEATFPEGWEQPGPPRARGAPARFGIEKLGTGFSTPTRVWRSRMCIVPLMRVRQLPVTTISCLTSHSMRERLNGFYLRGSLAKVRSRISSVWDARAITPGMWNAASLMGNSVCTW